MYLIINCDDFGMSEEINNGIVNAYNRGVLSSASLLITGSAVSHAFEIYQACPNLGVSLHIDLDDILGFGPSTHQGLNIYDIENELLNYMASSPEILFSIKNQIQKALDIGFKLTHLDGHHHAHLFPGILQQTVFAAKNYGISRIRFFESFYEDQRNILAYMKSFLGHAKISYPNKFVDFYNLQSLQSLEFHQHYEIMVHIAYDPTNPKDWRVQQYNKLTSIDFREDLLASKLLLANYSIL